MDEERLMRSLKPATEDSTVGTRKGLFWNQVRILLWKNWVLFRRKRRDKIRELALPLIFLGVLVAISQSLSNKSYSEQLTYKPEKVPSISGALKVNEQVILAPCVAPHNECRRFSDTTHTGDQKNGPHGLKNQVYNIGKRMSNDDEDAKSILWCCDTEDTAIAKVKKDPRTFVGIIAFNSTDGLYSSSGNISYRIRIDTEKNLNVDTSTDFRSSYKQQPNDEVKSYNWIFLPLQYAVNAAIIAIRANIGESQWKSLSITHFPTYAYDVNDAADQLKSILPIYMVIIFSLQIRILLGRILEEKETKITESMKISGMSTTAMWLSWLLSYGVFNTFVVILIVIVSWAGKLIEHSNMFLIFLFYFAFMCSCILFSILLSTFFSKSKTGGAVGMLGYLILSTPSYAFSGGSGHSSLALFSCVLPPTAFSIGNDILMEAEKVRGVANGATGIHFSNFFDAQATSISVSFGSVFLMLLLDLVLLSILAWYCDKVVPTEFGAKRHPLFCCQRSYWGSARMNEDIEKSRLLSINGDDHEGMEDRELSIESVSIDVRSRNGIKLRNLTKHFEASKSGSQSDNTVRAVDSLSLNIYENQITCLLGHNGAGKTTTISMLTGLCTPTSGDADVFGRSIVSDLDGVRRMVGSCPQHDTLFDDMTPLEHMQLFAGLKGYAKYDSSNQIDALFSYLGLTEHQHKSSKSLSGGQKRKLSVALALVGSPRVLFLDEPTSGMDPDSRRSVWSLLKRAKRNRVIVLTTHFMDEADILGDRIAILSRGKLAVCGSSLFLKSRFGIGYTLDVTASVQVEPHAEDADQAVERKIRRILQAIQSSIPLAKIQDRCLLENREHESRRVQTFNVSVLLPMQDASKFPDMFANLENPEAEIDDYGISITSLEQVFLKIGEVESRKLDDNLAEIVKDEMKEPSGDMQTETKEMHTNFVGPLEPLRTDKPAARQCPTASFLEQIKAQLWRRGRAQLRDKRGIYLQTFLPLVFIGVSFVFQSLKNISETTSPNPVVFGPDRLKSNAEATFLVSQYSDPKTRFVACLDNLLNNEWNWTAPGLPDPNGVAPPSLIPKTILSKGNGVGAVEATNTEDVRLNLYYNTSFINGIPTLLAIFSENLLNWNCLANSSEPPWTPLVTSLDPLPKTDADQQADLGTFLSNSLMGFYISLGMCTIPALQAVNIVRERSSGAISLQRIAGMKMTTFWLASWLYDSLQYLVTWLGATIIIVIFGNVSSSFPVHTLGALSLLILLFGLNIPWLAYVLSHDRTDAVSVQTFTLLFFYGMSTVLYLPVFALASPASSGAAQTAAKYLKYIFYVFPNFALAEGFSNVIIKAEVQCAGDSSENECSPPSPWSFDHGGIAIMYLLLSSVLWAALLIILEQGNCWFHFAEDNSHQESSVPVEELDDDVTEEKQRVENETENGIHFNENGIRCYKLKKVYEEEKGNVVAVRELSVDIQPSEVFALLGVNGAGKSTTLKMLTGNTQPTSGHGTLLSYDIQQHKDLALSTLGYCPQTDGLFDLLTGEEVLFFYAWLRGLPQTERQRLVQSALESLGLKEYASQLVGQYSGGNRRKMSLAIAYVGSPRIIFLDEPSTGMDPVSRRKMWRLVRDSRQGRSTVITTHWMEEADALCDRIGIMVNGQFACLGTRQHLKSKFGQGYRVEVKTEHEAGVQNLKKILENRFSDVTSEEQHESYGVFSIGSEDLSLSQVFRILSENSSDLGIGEYAVSQTTLEQVFLNIAKSQVEESHVEN